MDTGRRPFRALAWTCGVALVVGLAVDAFGLCSRFRYPFSSHISALWEMKSASTAVRSWSESLYHLREAAIPGGEPGSVFHSPYIYTPGYFYVLGALIRPTLGAIRSTGLGWHYAAWALMGAFFLYSMWILIRSRGGSRQGYAWALLALLGLESSLGFYIFLPSAELFALALFWVGLARVEAAQGRLLPGLQAGAAFFFAFFSKQVLWPYALLLAALGPSGGLRKRLGLVAAWGVLLAGGIGFFSLVYGPGFVEKTITIPSSHPVVLIRIKEFLNPRLLVVQLGLAIAVCAVLLAAIAQGRVSPLVRVSRAFALCAAMGWALLSATKAGSMIDKVFLPIGIALPYLAAHLFPREGAAPSRALASIVAVCACLAVLAGAFPRVRDTSAAWSPGEQAAHERFFADFRERKVAFPENAFYSLLTGNRFVDDGYGVYDAFYLAGRPAPSGLYSNLDEFDYIASSFNRVFQVWYDMRPLLESIEGRFAPVASGYPGIHLWKARKGAW